MGRLIYLMMTGVMIMMFATGGVGFASCADNDLKGFSIESTYARIVDALNSGRR